MEHKPPLRPLLAAVGGSAAAAAAAAPSSSSSSSSSGAASSSSNHARKPSSPVSHHILAPASAPFPQSVEPRPQTKVSTACQACKSRKTKCSGLPGPCAACAKHRSPCVFDESLDNRRKPSRKRQTDELLQYSRRLELLLDAIRSADKHRLADLIRLIQTGEAWEAVEAFLVSSPQHFQDAVRAASSASPVDSDETRSDLKRPRTDGDLRPRRKSVGLALLVSRNTVDVPARPWATVTSHADFVSHLMSCYFTWIHPNSFSIDCDLFLRDMRAANPNCTYCSPFLVNAILAEACNLVDGIQSFAVTGDREHMKARFLEEAKRLLDAEQGRPSLTLSQGLGSLASIASADGQDRVASLYLLQNNHICQDLDLSMSHPQSAYHPHQPQEKLRVTSAVVWASFSAAHMSAQALLRTSPASRPKTFISRRDDCDSVQWMPYPHQTDSSPGHYDCLQRQLCNMACITQDMNAVMFSEQPTHYETTWSSAQAFRGRLLQWKYSWPSCLQHTENALPHILILHVHYNALLLTAFAFFRPGLGQPSNPYYPEARDICHSAICEIARTVQIYDRSWTLSRISTAFAHACMLGIFTLMDELDANTHLHNTFLELHRAVRAYAQRCRTGHGFLRMITAAARDLNIRLPQDITSNVEAAQRQTRPGGEVSFSSAYPNFAQAIISPGMKARPMDELLERWVGDDDDGGRELGAMAIDETRSTSTSMTDEGGSNGGHGRASWR